MKTERGNSEFEVQIETMLDKVFRIIHEGMILNEYLTDKEYATLAVTLKNIHPPLRGLRISQCLDKPLSTYALTQLLHGNTTLEWFHLEANCIEETGIKAIAELLKQNDSLQRFYCGYLMNGLTLEDLQALSDMLITNTTLKDFNLYANTLNAEKTKIIADTLAKNPALEKLGLGSNEIGVDGAVALADALTKNSKLKELNLADCRLGDKGIKAIFNSLKQNTALNTLTLRRLSAEAIKPLSEMLGENKGLKKLEVSLYTSELSTEQMQQILEALRKNTVLQELSIQDDDGKLKAELEEIKQLLTKNAATSAKAPEGAAGDAKQETAKQPQPEAGKEKKGEAVPKPA